MKVVLINLPTRADLKVVNLGMYYIARVIKDAGYELSLLDCISEDLRISDILESLKEIKPDIIGLSGMVTTYYFLEPLCKELKKQFPYIPIMVGGSVGGSIVHIHEKYTGVDYIFQGEGEQTVIQFLERFKTGSSDFSDISGFYYRENGKFKYTFPKKFTGSAIGALDENPFPLYEQINMEFYANCMAGVVGSTLNHYPEYKGRKFRFFPLVPTRGCPYSCSFCHRSIRKYRTHSVDYLINQIKLLMETYKIDAFPLFDELIMVNPKWLGSFCDRIVEEKLDVVFFSGGGKPNLFTKEVLKKMRRAHFIKLGYGVESGSQKILDLMQKKTTVEQNFSAIMETYKAGIFSLSNFVFGHYGEDKNTIKETAQFISKTNRTKENYQIFFLAVYPGTTVYDYAMKNGHIKDEREHLFKVTGQDDYLLNLSEFETREELIFNVWKYLNLYDGLTFFRNGHLYLALNRWGRILLSYVTFYFIDKKWSRGEEFVKHVISSLKIHKFRNPDFFSEKEIDPFKKNANNRT